MELKDILSKCDHTLLRQDCTAQEIRELCDQAIKYSCASVCIPPAHIAGANQEQLAALGQFGEAYGALFQMTDDILDVEGDFEGMGKTLGKDQEENKLTYISLYGMDKAKELACQTADKAVEAIEIFGEGAVLLRDLAISCLSRRS